MSITTGHPALHSDETHREKKSFSRQIMIRYFDSLPSEILAANRVSTLDSLLLSLPLLTDERTGHRRSLKKLSAINQTRIVRQLQLSHQLLARLLYCLRMCRIAGQILHLVGIRF